MKIEYCNLYAHFIMVTANRLPSIPDMHRVRIEKYMTGVKSTSYIIDARTDITCYISLLKVSQHRTPPRLYYNFPNVVLHRAIKSHIATTTRALR
jgi:hypothetical protein